MRRSRPLLGTHRPRGSVDRGDGGAGALRARAGDGRPLASRGARRRPPRAPRLAGPSRRCGVAGPKGAVVLRGASGAGKSTLVAAAHAAGLGVLGDESILVAREDTDALAASRARADAPYGQRRSPRDPRRRRRRRSRAARRSDAWSSSTVRAPRSREARRVTTLLLGPRSPGPARLVALSPSQFQSEFAKGEIPQEHVDGGAASVARAWAARRRSAPRRCVGSRGRGRFVEIAGHLDKASVSVIHVTLWRGSVYYARQNARAEGPGSPRSLLLPRTRRQAVAEDETVSAARDAVRRVGAARARLRRGALRRDARPERGRVRPGARRVRRADRRASSRTTSTS